MHLKVATIQSMSHGVVPKSFFRILNMVFLYLEKNKSHFNPSILLWTFSLAPSIILEGVMLFEKQQHKTFLVALETKVPGKLIIFQLDVQNSRPSG